MSYIIVYKNGTVKRLLSIDGFQRTTDCIRFFSKEKAFTFLLSDIASVVFYP